MRNRHKNVVATPSVFLGDFCVDDNRLFNDAVDNDDVAPFDLDLDLDLPLLFESLLLRLFAVRRLDFDLDLDLEVEEILMDV